MYIIEIVHKKTGKRLGDTIITGQGTDYPRLTDGMIAAQAWLKKQSKVHLFEIGDYAIRPRVVGCL